jgi:hypothetical protein
MIILIFLIVYLFQRLDIDGKTKDVINKILFGAALVYLLLVVLTGRVELIR